MNYTTSIIGQDRATQYLQQLLERKCLPATQLWIGSDDHSQLQLAVNVTFWLFCQQRTLKQWEPCHQCQNCRLLERDQHPNVFVFTPNDGRLIGKSAMTEGIKQWQRKPLLNSPRVVIITPAEALTEEAANALLKVLEEPHPQIYFILCTSQIERILPTIRSRSAQLYLTSILSQQDANQLIQWLEILAVSSFSERLRLYNQAWSKLSDRTVLQQNLVVLADLCRIVLLLQAGVTPMYRLESALWKKLVQQHSIQQSLRALQTISKAYQALAQQAQPKLIIEHILLSTYYYV